MKRLCFVFLLFVLAISACAQNATPLSVGTKTPTATIKSTSTFTHTPTPTKTLTLTPTATPTLDFLSLGFPSTPIPYWETLSSKFLSYDEDHYYVYEKEMHGRPVRVVIHKDSGITEDFRDEIADWIFYAWATSWEVFDGFPYESYTFKIPIDQTYRGAHGIGYEFEVKDMLPIKGDWPKYQKREWRIDFAHEVFHAWNPNSLPPEDFSRAWFIEGCTEYYSYRITDSFDKNYGYYYGMNRMWSEYKTIGRSNDVPLANANKNELEGRLRVTIIYMKGGLVCYMIDKQLVNHGLSLDVLMQTLYTDFVTNGTKFTSESLQSTLESITNDDWSEFFNLYVFGTEPLPLNGTFEFLKH